MKTLQNFRLDKSTTLLLDDLAKEMDTTKTNVVEIALFDYAKKKKKVKNDLIKYVGILSDEDAKRMKKNISNLRKSKPVIRL